MELSPLSQNPDCNPLCRACHYREDTYPAQLQKKQAWAEQQLHRWFGFNNNRLQQILPAPPKERMAYRSKSWLRVQIQSEPAELSFGMFRSIQVNRRWVPEFVSWDTCPIHLQAIQQMIQKLKRHLRGDRLQLARTCVGVWMGTPHLVWVDREDLQPDLAALDWSGLLVPPFQSVWFHQNSQVGLSGRRIFGHHPLIQLHGPPVAGLHPIRAFRQNAQTLLAQARHQGVAFLLESAPTFVLDLYCGTGDLSLLLPPTMDWVGIDASLHAIEFAQTLNPSERKQHVAYTGFVEHRLADPQVIAQVHGADSGTYSLWLNPPRSGLSLDARQALWTLIERKRAERIAYLSCSASSLARDLLMFEDLGYAVQVLQPYDFFPQTEHFETLALLSSRV